MVRGAVKGSKGFFVSFGEMENLLTSRFSSANAITASRKSIIRRRSGTPVAQRCTDERGRLLDQYAAG